MSGASEISLIVPAAGRSERMGKNNKLLLPLGRRAVLERVVMAALGTDPLEVIVVTGAERERVESALAPYPVRLIHNHDHGEGMASSLRAGIRASSVRAAGFAIMLGDLPFVRSTTIAAVCAGLGAGRIVLPRFEGRQGHPVVFADGYRDELAGLSGDVGARSVIEAHPHAVVIVDTDDPGILLDVDTMADYRRTRQRLR